jgi:hypothetical protein
MAAPPPEWWITIYTRGEDGQDIPDTYRITTTRAEVEALAVEVNTLHGYTLAFAGDPAAISVAEFRAAAARNWREWKYRSRQRTRRAEESRRA